MLYNINYYFNTHSSRLHFLTYRRLMDKHWGFRTINDIPNTEHFKKLVERFEGVDFFTMCAELDKMKTNKKKGNERRKR